MLIFKEIQLLPEIFLGISIIYLVLHGTFLSTNNKYLVIQNSVLYLSVLIISLFCLLLVNNSVQYHNLQIWNGTIIIDYLGNFSKSLIALISIFCLLIMQYYLTAQKVNYFEYNILILFALNLDKILPTISSVALNDSSSVSLLQIWQIASPSIIKSFLLLCWNPT